MLTTDTGSSTNLVFCIAGQSVVESASDPHPRPFTKAEIEVTNDVVIIMVALCNRSDHYYGRPM